MASMKGPQCRSVLFPRLGPIHPRSGKARRNPGPGPVWAPGFLANFATVEEVRAGSRRGVTAQVMQLLGEVAQGAFQGGRNASARACVIAARAMASFGAWWEKKQKPPTPRGSHQFPHPSLATHQLTNFMKASVLPPTANHSWCPWRRLSLKLVAFGNREVAGFGLTRHFSPPSASCAWCSYPKAGEPPPQRAAVPTSSTSQQPSTSRSVSPGRLRHGEVSPDFTTGRVFPTSKTSPSLENLRRSARKNH